MANPSDDAGRLLQFFPASARPLLEAKGADLVKRIGMDVVRDVVLDVLSGVNLRDSTEMLTRRRIAMLNAATLVMLISAGSTLADLDKRLPYIAAEGLGSRRSKPDRWLLLWILGLTEKAFQNVLRDDAAGMRAYAARYAEAVEESADTAERDWGQLTGQLVTADATMPITWLFAIYLAGTLGAQTLAIRGSEKSMYGKLFERLILGGLLHILGFRFIAQSELKPSDERVFWLTSRDEKRESDATLLFEAGKGVRFDIGFIGRGNPEISLDKVSRFEREIEFGRKLWYLATFIIVDTVSPKSRVAEFARAIDGTVIQMSLGFWPKLLATELQRTISYESPLTVMPDREIREYIKARLASAPLDRILAFAAAGSDVPETIGADESNAC